jgi:hypothetical protein
MSEDSNGNFIGVKAVYDAVLRLEGKVDGQSARLDTEIDAVKSRMDRLEGRLEGAMGLVKWLGPTSIVALVIGIAKMANLLP